MPEGTKVALKENGPLLVSGDFKLFTPAGEEIPVEGTVVALCRCGASANKPFCDGSHKRVEFKSGDGAPAE